MGSPQSQHSTTDTPAKVDLGILLVHGIGQHREGEVLNAAGQPLFKWLRTRLPNVGKQIRLTSALLRPSERGRDDPAHFCFDVEAEDGDSQQVTVAESLWAHEFNPPSFPEAVTWLLGPGTWLLFRHLINEPSRILRRWKAFQNLTLWIRRWRGSVWGGFFVAPGFFGGFLLFLFAVFPFQLLGMFLLLLWYFPLKTVRSRAQLVFEATTEILGDCYRFTANSIARRAILDRVQRDLAWLEERAERVAVVAHSQGAAVAFEALGDRHQSPPELFLTYGSGIRKLYELGKHESGALKIPKMVSLVTTLSLFTLLALALVVVDIIVPAPIIDGGLLFVVLLLLAVVKQFFDSLTASAYEREKTVTSDLAQEFRKLLLRGCRWVDLYATDDPVPGGPLLTPEGMNKLGKVSEKFSSKSVVNGMRLLSDHTSYWQSTEDFVDQVVTEIDRWTGFKWLHDKHIAAQLRRRTNRRRLMEMRTLIFWGTTFGVLWLCAYLAPVWRLGVPKIASYLLDDVVATDRFLQSAKGWLYVTILAPLSAVAIHLLAAWAWTELVAGRAWNALNARLRWEVRSSLRDQAMAAIYLALYLVLAVVPLVAIWKTSEAGSYAPLLAIPMNTSLWTYCNFSVSAFIGILLVLSLFLLIRLHDPDSESRTDDRAT